MHVTGTPTRAIACAQPLTPDGARPRALVRGLARHLAIACALALPVVFGTGPTTAQADPGVAPAQAKAAKSGAAKSPVERALDRELFAASRDFRRTCFVAARVAGKALNRLRKEVRSGSNGDTFGAVQQLSVEYHGQCVSARATLIEEVQTLRAAAPEDDDAVAQTLTLGGGGGFDRMLAFARDSLGRADLRVLAGVMRVQRESDAAGNPFNYRNSPLHMDLHQGAPKRFECRSLLAAADGRVAGFCTGDAGPPATPLGCRLRFVGTGEIVEILDDLTPVGDGYSFETGPIGHDVNVEIACELGEPTSSEPLAALDRSVYDIERIHVPAPIDTSASPPDRKERKLRAAQARGVEREFKKITKEFGRAARAVANETGRDLHGIARGARSGGEEDAAAKICAALTEFQKRVGAQRANALKSLDAARLGAPGTEPAPERALDTNSGYPRDGALFAIERSRLDAERRVAARLKSLRVRGIQSSVRVYQPFAAETDQLCIEAAYTDPSGTVEVWVDVPRFQDEQRIQLVIVSGERILESDVQTVAPLLGQPQDSAHLRVDDVPSGPCRIELILRNGAPGEVSPRADFESFGSLRGFGSDPIDPPAPKKWTPLGSILELVEILAPTSPFGAPGQEVGNPRKHGGLHEGVVAVPGRDGFVLVNHEGTVVDQGVGFEGVDFTTALLFYDSTQPDFSQYRVMWGGPRTYLLNNYAGNWSATLSLDGSSGITALVPLEANEAGITTRFLVVRPGRRMVTQWSPGKQTHVLLGFSIPTAETGLVVSACQDPVSELYYFLFERQADENRSFLYWSDGGPSSQLEGGIECGRGARVVCVAGNQLFVGNEDTQDVWQFVRGEDDAFDFLRTLPATGPVRTIATNVVGTDKVHCMFADSTSMQFFNLNDADGSTLAYKKIDDPAGVRHMTASGDGGFNASGTNPATGDDFLLLVDGASYTEVLGPDFKTE